MKVAAIATIGTGAIIAIIISAIIIAHTIIATTTITKVAP
jgi:hypothetical protein